MVLYIYIYIIYMETCCICTVDDLIYLQHQAYQWNIHKIMMGSMARTCFIQYFNYRYIYQEQT